MINQETTTGREHSVISINGQGLSPNVCVDVSDQTTEDDLREMMNEVREKWVAPYVEDREWVPKYSPYLATRSLEHTQRPRTRVGVFGYLRDPRFRVETSAETTDKELADMIRQSVAWWTATHLAVLTGPEPTSEVVENLFGVWAENAFLMSNCPSDDD